MVGDGFPVSYETEIFNLEVGHSLIHKSDIWKTRKNSFTDKALEARPSASSLLRQLRDDSAIR